MPQGLLLMEIMCVNMLFCKQNQWDDGELKTVCEGDQACVWQQITNGRLRAEMTREHQGRPGPLVDCRDACAGEAREKRRAALHGWDGGAGSITRIEAGHKQEHEGRP